MIARGDIRWFRFANPDKRRPVLVLGRPDVLPFLDQVPVIPLSTQARDFWMFGIRACKAGATLRASGVQCRLYRHFARARRGPRNSPMISDIIEFDFGGRLIEVQRILVKS